LARRAARLPRVHRAGSAMGGARPKSAKPKRKLRQPRPRSPSSATRAASQGSSSGPGKQGKVGRGPIGPKAKAAGRGRLRLIRKRGLGGSVLVPRKRQRPDGKRGPRGRDAGPRPDADAGAARKRGRLGGAGPGPSAVPAAPCSERRRAWAAGALGSVPPGTPGAVFEAQDSQEEAEEDVIDCVVKVFAACSEPNYAAPWSNKLQDARTGTAFSIYSKSRSQGKKRRWLLTNAHVVRHASVVQVRRRSDHHKYIAKVLCIGLDCDLAILTVDDPAFWKSLPNVELQQELPDLQDEVTVVGYPIGGDNTCVTVGVVSRIDMQRYSLCGSMSLLAIQIDAAINPGNSGGPCFLRNTQGKAFCIGVAFQVMGPSDAENVGYIIPVEVVEHFLEDFTRNHSYRGFGGCGFSVQALESAHMRSVLGLRPGRSGVLVRTVDPASPASKVLAKGDIIMQVEGQVIGNDGKVPFRGNRNERMEFVYNLTRRFVGESCTFTVMRKKQIKEVKLPLARITPLVPADPPVPPPYYSVGGLVFVPLTEPFLLDEFGPRFDQEAPMGLVWHWAESRRRFPEQEVVVLSQVFAAPLTVGFTDFYDMVLLRFNGKEPKNLRHLIQMVQSCKEANMTFDLERDKCIILPRKKAMEETRRIVLANMIHHDRSVQYRDL